MNSRLSQQRRTTIIQGRVKYVTPMVLCLLAHGALAQQQSTAAPEPKRDELDVTMQIIVDPDAKLPDEVVRRIPLPERKSAPPRNTEPTASSAADKDDKERAREAKEVGREVGQSAKERSKEAAEQREQARRAAAEERRRHPDPPANPPGRPPRP